MVGVSSIGMCGRSKEREKAKQTSAERDRAIHRYVYIIMTPRGLAAAWLSLLHVLLLLSSHAPTAVAQLRIQYLDGDDGVDTRDCLTNSSIACKTLHYALDQPTITNLELRVRPGRYYYSNFDNQLLELIEPKNFILRGDPDDQGKVVFQCRNRIDNATYNNMAIIKGSNVTIEGITVENCGSTPAGIYALYGENLLVTNCTFRNNGGGGLGCSNTQSVRVENCVFADNFGIRPDLRADETAFNFRTLNSGGLGLLYTTSSLAVATVHNCTFMNNSASVHPLNANDPRPQPYTPFGHGGALVIHFSNYTNNSMIEINDCVFHSNSAYHSGGAIYVTMIKHPRNNHLVIRNSLFFNCTANRTGGGLSVQVFDVEENNTVEVDGSNFTACSANEGGGALSLILEDSLATTTRSLANESTILTVRDTLFERNRCPIGGSAVGLVSNARIDQFSFVASFQDCEFTGNQAKSQGAFLTFRFRVEFVRSNLFSYNEGGAMLVFQTKVDTSGRLEFWANTAYMGGAVTLEDQSLFNLFSGVEVLFRENGAVTVGGALLVNNPTVGADVDPIYNTNCFFQYEVETDGSKTLPPQSWIANVTFLNNTAGTAGAAIYASDISVCLFTTTNCTDGDGNSTHYERSVFLEPPFDFQNNQVVGVEEMAREMVHNVATEPSQLNISPNQHLSSPGDVLSVQLLAFDQSGNHRAALWTLEDDAISTGFSYFSLPAESHQTFIKTFEVSNASQTECDQWLQWDTPTGDNESLEFFVIEGLTGEVVYKQAVEINVTCCHPGYHYVSENKTCSFTLHYPHILRAEASNRYIYLNPGYYAGFYNDSSLNESYFVTSLIPEAFQSCDRELERTGCLYKYDSADQQCRGNRTGFMCGQCPPGQGVDLTLRSCKECTATDTVLLVFICVAVVVGSLLVLIFNIGVPNDLKGFLFFAQVVGFVYRHGSNPYSDSLSWDFHVSHLLGFSVYLPICPFTSLPALWTAAFGLLPSLLAISTVTIYIICARVFKPLGKRTVFRGIWLLTLFVYKYIADTVANILKCVALEGEDVKSRYQNALKLTFYYDGNVPCFSGEHLGFAIPALLLLVFVVLLGPAVVILISFKRYKTTQAFTDVITDGVKLRMRWWGGFDLIRRLMFIVVLTLFDFTLPVYAQLSLCMVSVAVLGVLCVAKPYSDRLTNIIEAVILLDLLIIAFIFLNSKESAKVDPAIFQILLLLPYIYAFLNIGIKLLLPLWTKYIPMGPRAMLKLLPQKMKSKIKPTRRKERPLGLVKSSSIDHSGLLDSTGEEDRPEGRDSQYVLYREELLDT